MQTVLIRCTLHGLACAFDVLSGPLHRVASDHGHGKCHEQAPGNHFHDTIHDTPPEQSLRLKNSHPIRLVLLTAILQEYAGAATAAIGLLPIACHPKTYRAV